MTAARLAALTALAAAAIAVPTTAQAQPGVIPSRATLAPVPVAEPVDPGLAFGLSAGVTALGIGVSYLSLERDTGNLFLAGAAITLVGPSVGHFYSREIWTRGLITRLVGTAAVASGAYLIVTSESFLFDNDNRDRGSENLGVVLALLGLGAVTVGSLDDIFTSPSAAHRYNHSVETRRLAVTPTLAPDRAGLAVAGTF